VYGYVIENELRFALCMGGGGMWVHEWFLYYVGCFMIRLNIGLYVAVCLSFICSFRALRLCM
jgi:hypothetical protein